MVMGVCYVSSCVPAAACRGLRGLRSWLFPKTPTLPATRPSVPLPRTHVHASSSYSPNGCAAGNGRVEARRMAVLAAYQVGRPPFT